MDLDDSYDEEWDDASGYGDRDYDSPAGADASKDGFDPMDITNPVSSYLFLSDDAQDEIEGAGRKRMKCTSCGYRFKAETFDPCPKCGSYLTEERFLINEDEENGEERANMKCLNCGHQFSGDIFDDCPECFSSDTEELETRSLY